MDLAPVLGIVLFIGFMAKADLTVAQGLQSFADLGQCNLVLITLGQIVLLEVLQALGAGHEVGFHGGTVNASSVG
ncbi:hypothetical protein D3C78_1798080 [compost metagenome]